MNFQNFHRKIFDYFNQRMGHIDSIIVDVPIVANRDKGLNKITITVDADNNVDIATNELYDWVTENHLKTFKNNILTSIPQLKNSPFEWAPELYFNDFVNIIAANDGGNSGINTKMLATILKLLIGASKSYRPILLHAYWWTNANEVLAQLQLAQMAPVIIQNIKVQSNAIDGKHQQ